MQKCYLALGCFWKPEENFRTKPGILETEVGYAGGKVMNVTYEQVCRGDTEHAEVVKLTYDQKEISYEKILDLFFKMHDPTQKDMQYPDIGTQYRSEIFYLDEKQKLSAIKIKNELNKKLDGKIETIISKINNYCKAEDYHQKYIGKNRQ